MPCNFVSVLSLKNRYGHGRTGRIGGAGPVMNACTVAVNKTVMFSFRSVPFQPKPNAHFRPQITSISPGMHVQRKR